jgi:hypothetical protein
MVAENEAPPDYKIRRTYRWTPETIKSSNASTTAT